MAPTNHQALDGAHSNALESQKQNNSHAHQEAYDASNAGGQNKQHESTAKKHLPEVSIANQSQASDAELQKAAEAIRKACVGFGTDETAIWTVLESMRTEGDRTRLAEIYKRKYNVTLDWELRGELSGNELDKAINLLYKKDNDPASNRAGRIHLALTESNQWIYGRSTENCQKDIRDTLSTMNSVEIAALDKAYQSRYGTSLRNALMSDKSLSQGTKEAIDIYLNGSDKRTPDMTLKLGEIALRTRDIAMFQETMSNASPQVRQQFMNADGDRKLKAAFGTGTDYEHAKDFVSDGKISTASKIRSNTSWMGDNEVAIERSIKEMKQDERTAYLQGRDLANGKNVPGLTEDQKRHAGERYNEIHTALTSAGNANEVTRWEDMISVKGGTLVSKMAAHEGTFKDDDINVILSDIENMDKADWNRLKTDRQFRGDIEKVLGGFLSSSDLDRVKKALDDKQNCNTFEEAKTKRRSVDQVVTDNSGFFSDDEEGIYKAIENMTPAEQKRYREDAQFRKQLDEKVTKGLDAGAERDAAREMLDRVLKGQTPERDIIAKLNVHASDVDTDEAAVIRDVQEAFQKDPQLREKINNPKTAEEKEFSTKFKQALHAALDPYEYTRYAEPLLKTGNLDFEIQNELNKGVLNDDEQGTYKDLVALAKRTDPASTAEKQRILHDSAYQEKALGNLSADEREVALNALKQGEMRPEDIIRSQMIGAGTGEEEIKEALSKLTPEQKIEVSKAYSEKYHGSLSADLMEELGGQDAREVQRELRQPAKTAQDEYDRARDEYYESRDGIGSSFVDGAWDGTGYMSDEALSNFRAALTKSSSEFKQLSPEEQKELSENLRTNLDAFVQSKGALADGAVDAIIIAAGVGAAFYTGGVSLSLLGKTALAGAALKLAIKPGLMGADYDSSSVQPVIDALTGAVDAMSLVVGPAQLAQVLRLGGKVATTATTKLFEEGAGQLIKTEMREQAEHKIFQTISNAISKGEQGVSDKAIENLATELAVEGGEKQLAAQLKKAIQEGIEKESRSALKSTMTEIALNQASGAAGGGASGAIRATAEWDTNKSISENMTKVFEQAVLGAAIGGTAAGVATVGFKVLGGTYRMAKNAAGEIGASTRSSAVDAGNATSFEVKVSKTASGSPELRTEDNPHIGAIRRKDGSILELGKDQSVKLQDGDVPLLRVDSEGNPIGRNGERINKDGTKSEVVRTPGKAGGDVTGSGGKELSAVSVEGTPIQRDTWYVIGRTDANNAHISINDSRVSGQHASIYVDADGNRWIRDMGSTNGTFVNGNRIKPNDNVRLKPNDRVSLGPVELKIAQTEYKVSLGASDITLKPGQEAPIGRNHQRGLYDDRVSRDHARLGADDKGVYIIDSSSNGTYIRRDGQTIKLTKGSKFYLNQNDEVSLGASLDKNGERLQIKVAGDKAFDKPLPPVMGPIRSREALNQSNDYARYHQVTGRIEDGWHMAGADSEFQPDGSFTKYSRRPALVVDRQNDPVLKAVLEEAKTKFGSLPPKQRAVEITKWVKQLMTPAGWSENQLDNWYDAFNNQFDGQRLYFGELIRQGKGVCSQQAILLKLIGDEFPDMQVRLVRGHYGFAPNMNDLNHAWTEIKFPDGDRLVFDPRHEQLGVPYSKLRQHHPAYDMHRNNPSGLPFKVGDRIDHDGVGNWKVLEIRDSHVMLAHDATREETVADIMKLNPGRQLRVGDKFKVLRSSGEIDDGWQLVGRLPNGELKFSKPDSYLTKVPIENFRGNTPGHAAPVDEANGKTKNQNTNSSNRNTNTNANAAVRNLPALQLVGF